MPACAIVSVCKARNFACVCIFSSVAARGLPALQLAKRSMKDYTKHMESCNIKKAIEVATTLLKGINEYIADVEPWRVLKNVESEGD